MKERANLEEDDVVAIETLLMQSPNGAPSLHRANNLSSTGRDQVSC